jgi:hypothetical protein
MVFNNSIFCGVAYMVKEKDWFEIIDEEGNVLLRWEEK